MKNKIAIWCALFALLVALVPPSSARANTTETTADDVKYDNAQAYIESLYLTDIELDTDARYLIFSDTSYWYIYEFLDINAGSIYAMADLSNSRIYIMDNVDFSCKLYQFREPNSAIINGSNFASLGDNAYKSTCILDNESCCRHCIDETFSNLVYSDFTFYENVHDDDTYIRNFDLVLYESNRNLDFDFTVWCTDAGLNCGASSAHISNVPYAYNADYMHLVRKSEDGTYWLTVIYDYESSPYVLTCSGFGNDETQLHLATRNSSSSSGVYTYRYNNDGWQYVGNTTYTFSPTTWANLGLYFNGDSGFSLEYTNRDIYSSLNASAPYIEATAEYVEEGAYDDVVMVTPTPVPTPTPTPIPTGSVIDWSDISLSDIPQVIEDFKDSLLALGDLIGSVPHIVGAVFSFVPTWCLTLIGLFIGLLGVLIVVKFVRG